MDAGIKIDLLIMNLNNKSCRLHVITFITSLYSACHSRDNRDREKGTGCGVQERDVGIAWLQSAKKPIRRARGALSKIPP